MYSLLVFMILTAPPWTAGAPNHDLLCTGPEIVRAIIAKVSSLPELDPFHSEPLPVTGGRLFNITLSGLSRMRSTETPHLDRLDDNQLRIVFPVKDTSITGTAAYEIHFLKGGMSFVCDEVTAEFDGVLDMNTNDVKLARLTILRIGNIDVSVDGGARMFASSIKEEFNNRRPRMSSRLSSRVPLIFNEKVRKVDIKC